MKRITIISMMLFFLGFLMNAQSTGEYVTHSSGTPSQDHFFVRSTINDLGVSLQYDNLISFKSGGTQLVWIYLDDDEIYQNEAIQSLTPMYYKSGYRYHEITYNSFQFDIYLPQSLEIISETDDQYNEIYYVQGDRLPSSSQLSWAKKSITKIIDGIEYNVYTFTCFNSSNYGAHFSARNATLYERNGALKKDATLFGIYLKNKRQNYSENRINGDMIIGNMMLSLYETSEMFFYGTGGMDVENRFMRYNRVALYGSNGIEPVIANSITLNQTTANMMVGEALQLTANVLPSNATNKTVTWSSSNTSIASVSSDGLVIAQGKGTAIITATTTDGSNLSATCAVTVNNRLATSISLSKSNTQLNVGESEQLIAYVYPDNATNKTVNWRSSNENIARVSSNGLVTAVSAGTATITATTTDGSNLSASCVVTVSIIPVTSISLNQTNLTLDIEETYRLIPSFVPNYATYKTVTWKSSNNAVAKVSNEGLVTPVAPGTATITATTTDGSNLSASCQVTVVKRVKAISLNKSNLTLILPETAQLVAYITPSDATNPSLNWTSTNTAVATVDASGIVTPVAVGTATIKATTRDGSNLTALCQVTVKVQLVTSLSLDKTSLSMNIGKTTRLNAIIAPDNASNKTLTWRSSNTSIATVDNTGLVTAISGGTATITASTTDGSYLNAYCTVEVLPDYYITLDTLSHIRGAASQLADLQVGLVNKNPISGIQFDVTLPSEISFNLVGDMPDVWLDEARATRSHSATASRLNNGNYRVLVTSSSSKDLRGNDGVLVHMNMLLPKMHDIGNHTITVSNVIASEADETRHALNNRSTQVCFYYLVGDADANGIVDIADHTATASKILGKSPSPFYYDAANVDNNYALEVVDLVGITNIALEIKPQTVRQAPAYGQIVNRLFCDRIHTNASGDIEVNIGMDCAFDFAGFQMDLELPRGLALSNASLGENASCLNLAIETMPDGKIRILGTSFSDAEVDGLCSQLLTLTLKAERNYLLGTDIEFADVLFAERNMTAHYLDASCIDYVEPSSVYELMDDTRLYIENGYIIVDTPVAGKLQLIAVDGRMMEYDAQVGHNKYPVNVTGIYIIHFNDKTIKVRL